MTTSPQRPAGDELLLNASSEQINALNRFVNHDAEALPDYLSDDPTLRRTLGKAAVSKGKIILKDIENEELAEKIENLGLDPLTSDYGIYNLHGFKAAMKRRDALLWSTRAKDTVKPKGTLVMFIDGNDIGAINKSLGHDTGDEAIRLLANVICDNVRDEDIICRRGGDEFVVVADIVGDSEEEARQISKEITTRLQEALANINDDNTGLRSASLGTGYLEGPKISTAIDQAIHQADVDMCANKRAIKEKIIFN